MSSKIKPWLVLGGIFIIGIVTGAALTVGLAPHFSRFARSPAPHDMKKDWMVHLTRDLNLTAEQQAKIQPIVEDAATKLQALHREEKEQGAEIFKSTDDQIKALLTPDQQVKMQTMDAEREKLFPGHKHADRAFRREGPTDGPPPPPPPAK